jgi:uncharacterized membrane protein YccC
MFSHVPTLQRFFYSHYFFGGLRQAAGVLLPAIILAGIFKLYTVGVIAAIGATCVAIIDQPGGPRRYRRNEMLGGVVLGSLTVALTGLASSHTVLIWLLVPLLCFSFSMLSVFGKRGGLIGFACLLLMTMTMRLPLTPDQVLLHTLYSFGGGVFYFTFSFGLSRLFWFREEQHSLSVALFATADYLVARSRFYDASTDLDDCYRQLVNTQSDMTDKHQTARDMVLRELPTGVGRGERYRVSLLNIFTDMIGLLDNLVASQTDYVTLRRRLPGSDIMLFAHDALYALSLDVSHIALTVARNKRSGRCPSVKAELRAIEYELEHYRRQGMVEKEPEVYALLVQVLRRLRNVSHIVGRMADQTAAPLNAVVADEKINKSLVRFLSRQEIGFSMLTSNLRLDSAHFRYAFRVSVAAMLGMTVPVLLAPLLGKGEIASEITTHSYWIILTIIAVMKPGFAQTRQRNGWRLAGTVIGCVLALTLFNTTSNIDVYVIALIVSSVLGNSLVQVNYMLSAIFNTIFVLLVFHFISPNDTMVVGERFVDTFIGCVLALICSYVLPWWEANYMAPLARAAKTANQRFFAAGMHYAELNRAYLQAVEQWEARKKADPDQANAKAETEATADGKPIVGLDNLRAERDEAYLAWRLTRKSMHTAFSNFASAFYRMMAEPVARQKNVSQFNNLLIQNHVFASQISAAVPILASLDTVPEGVQKSLEAIREYLNEQDANPPVSIETEGELAMLAYPLRQMVRAAQLIRTEMRLMGVQGA